MNFGIDFGGIGNALVNIGAEQLQREFYKRVGSITNGIVDSAGGGCSFDYNMHDTQISILGGVYQDGYMGVMQERTESTTTPTRYPTETAMQIHSDHVHINPRKIDFSILVSGDGFFTPNQVFGALRQLQESREPVTIVSNLSVLPNMIITSISGVVTPESDKALIDISAEEVRTNSFFNLGSLFNFAVTEVTGALNHQETECYQSNGGAWTC